jgi:hypothetical protein
VSFHCRRAPPRRASIPFIPGPSPALLAVPAESLHTTPKAFFDALKAGTDCRRMAAGASRPATARRPPSIGPVIIAVCAIGARRVDSSFFDVVMMMVFGVLGDLSRKLGSPLAPRVLARVPGAARRQPRGTRVFKGAAA